MNMQATVAFLRKKPAADAKGSLKRRLSFTSQVQRRLILSLDMIFVV